MRERETGGHTYRQTERDSLDYVEEDIKVIMGSLRKRRKKETERREKNRTETEEKKKGKTISSYLCKEGYQFD